MLVWRFVYSEVLEQLLHNGRSTKIYHYDCENYDLDYLRHYEEYDLDYFRHYEEYDRIDRMILNYL